MRLLFLLIGLVLMLVSCRKDKDDNKDIYHQWKWENSIGGFTGNDTVKPTNNTTVTLTLKRDMSFIEESNGQPVSQGSFRITTVGTQKILQADSLSSVTGVWFINHGAIVTIKEDRLHLTEYQVSEPYTHYFK